MHERGGTTVKGPTHGEGWAGARMGLGEGRRGERRRRAALHSREELV